MNIFPEETFTTTELNVLASQLDHPTVKKYLRMQARELVLSIITSEPAEGESDASYLRRAAAVRGQVAVYEALGSIQSVKPKENVES